MTYAMLAGTILAALVVALLAADLRLIRRQARWERRRAAILTERLDGYPSLFQPPPLRVD